ncbi:hypothetical protein OG21DRAFT_1313702 [Imleria badia]|nr:hypothetical protein OG21DRAFT_1313702 [Imleria badia]
MEWAGHSVRFPFQLGLVLTEFADRQICRPPSLPLMVTLTGSPVLVTSAIPSLVSSALGGRVILNTQLRCPRMLLTLPAHLNNLGTAFPILDGFYDTQYPQPERNVSDFVVSSYVHILSIFELSRNPSTTPCRGLRLQHALVPRVLSGNIPRMSTSLFHSPTSTHPLAVLLELNTHRHRIRRKRTYHPGEQRALMHNGAMQTAITKEENND